MVIHTIVAQSDIYAIATAYAELVRVVGNPHGDLEQFACDVQNALDAFCNAHPDNDTDSDSVATDTRTMTSLPSGFYLQARANRKKGKLSN